jgi:serine/threonine protein kinase
LDLKLRSFMQVRRILNLYCSLWELNNIRNWLGEILSALSHIQSLGYVYRDLKPENVMVDEEGHCKLVDFGFVTTPDENGMMRTMCGTSAYLSPEQLDRKFFGGYTKICDWWSCGVFLYELRTGTVLG